MVRVVAVAVTPDRKIEVSPDDDNRFLECAEAAEADFLVTGNRRHFPELFGKTRVVAPREFLTELGF
jgi:predicted nucleic acid-binding protein